MTSISVDSIPLMKQLAEMANMDLAPISKMVLVLDPCDVPRLFIESYLEAREDVKLVKVPLEVEVSDEPLLVNTTTMLNKKWITKIPKPNKDSK